MEVKQYKCSVSGEVIPEARVEFLLDSGIPPENWTTVKHSQVRKKQAFFVQPSDLGEGEVDSSTLMIVDRVYSDTVRSVMREAVLESDPDAADEPVEDLKADS